MKQNITQLKKIKIKPIVLKGPTLLKGSSLEEQNKYIKSLLNKNSINAEISFQPAALQIYIDQTKSFSKGLVAYLRDLEKQLDSAIIDNKKLKLFIFQILPELGSLGQTPQHAIQLLQVT